MNLIYLDRYDIEIRFFDQFPSSKIDANLRSNLFFPTLANVQQDLFHGIDGIRFANILSRINSFLFTRYFYIQKRVKTVYRSR